MSLADARAELEHEITWRQNELRLLQNELMRSRDPMERRRYRRPMMLLLYAHYEGFCLVALKTYIAYINREQLSCEDAVPAIRAGSWADVFRALENTDAKSKVFRNALPDDTQLHRAARRRDFAEQVTDFLGRQVDMPDDVINTESNLWPVVLRKNLFQVGLEWPAFADYDSDISHLLQRRNNIAHGADVDGIDEDVYLRLQGAVYDIMERLMKLVLDALTNRTYRQAVPSRPGVA